MADNEIKLSALEKCRYDDEGVDFWYARDLREHFGYKSWESFERVVLKAAENCRTVGLSENDHFRQVTKMVRVGSGAERLIEDYAVSRYGAYLMAMNADASKPEVAFLKHYFAVRAREAEMIEQRALDSERLESREQLKATEKVLSGVLAVHGVDGKEFGLIRSKGDKALFGGRSTQDMKDLYGIKSSRPLADFLPTLSLAAKTLVNEMTKLNVEGNALTGEPSISKEHVQNSKSVRSMLAERGIKPEDLPAEEDITKVQRRLASEERALTRETLGEIE